jgi:tRNA uridine 5-carboxymethylaminomethyl modification enzyme
MSTSMPEDVQWAMYRTIPGLRRCEFTRLGYAIEYDCIDSLELRPTLESLRIGGLFFAGQINGTSGYEEAACQGLLAGMNAALKMQGKEQVILTRDLAYIGVLTDDLTTKGTDEPYRMMTSRAEHRLFLRQDNADLRLTEIGFRAGLATEERMERTRKKKEATEQLIRDLQATRFAPGEALNGLLREKGQPETAGSLRAEELLRRPEITMKDLQELKPEWQEILPAAAEQAEIEVKYAGYLEKQAHLIAQARKMEATRLAEDIPYEEIEHLRLEARQKLAKQKPVSLAAAGRIPGVNPADVAVLTVWLEKQRRMKENEQS